MKVSSVVGLSRNPSPATADLTPHSNSLKLPQVISLIERVDESHCVQNLLCLPVGAFYLVVLVVAPYLAERRSIRAAAGAAETEALCRLSARRRFVGDSKRRDESTIGDRRLRRRSDSRFRLGR